MYSASCGEVMKHFLLSTRQITIAGIFALLFLLAVAVPLVAQEGPGPEVRMMKPTMLAAQTSDVDKYRYEYSIREGIGWSRLLPFYAQIAMPFLSYFSANDTTNMSIGILSSLIAVNAASVAVSVGRSNSVKDKELNIALSVLASASSAAFAYYNFSTLSNTNASDRPWLNYGFFQLSMIPLEVSVFTVRFD